ncbi:Tetraketide alpha-pyrone reductase 1 [Hibiscus syriacus]|uniref:Tetraketide alpha-pyrone reductase 1 n=1 Tax=Hibiscus syriacus TaxID=106335 RepID=A0A6A2ZKK1_HIBSY|nr:Tetraketide alpha-pyrone reductase 1 [Hibiscus syriacus]
MHDEGGISYSYHSLIDDPGKTQHLLALEGAEDRLKLFKANLLEQGSYDSAIEGCEGVSYTPSPFYHDVKDPEAELLDPAVKGTLNVLNSCTMSSSIRRVILTSSIAALTYNGKSTKLVLLILTTVGA